MRKPILLSFFFNELRSVTQRVKISIKLFYLLAWRKFSGSKKIEVTKIRSSKILAPSNARLGKYTYIDSECITYSTGGRPYLYTIDYVPLNPKSQWRNQGG